MPKQERVQYHKPQEGSQQYEYDGDDAVHHQEQDRIRQGKARKAGELATEKMAEIDELLDEIDEVLETNATEFMNDWIQAGGE